MTEVELDAQQAQILCRTALLEMEFARRYTLELLEATPQERWTELPAGGASTLLWQVGHLTVSQYGLLLFRQRGRAEIDLELVPGWFRKQYGRGSKPSTDAAAQPSPVEMLERLQRVHHQALEELTTAPPERLLDPIDLPYVAYPMKIGAVLFAPMHEMLHSGQIGALRRQLGLEPIR